MSGDMEKVKPIATPPFLGGASPDVAVGGSEHQNFRKG